MNKKKNSPGSVDKQKAAFGTRFVLAIRAAIVLLLPGLIAVAAMLPANSMGPIAFAIRQDFAISVSQIGLAFTSFFLASAVLTPLGGWAVGRWRTVDIVRVCLLFTAVLTAVMSLSGSVVHLMVFSVLTGVINGIMTPAVNVLITRLVPVKLRGLAFGIKVGAAPFASSLAGLGAWAAANYEFPWRATYWVGAGLSILIVGCTYFLGIPRRSDTSPKKRNKPEHLSRSRHNTLTLLAVGGLLGASGTGVMPPFLVDSLIHGGMEPGGAASLLALGSAIGVVSRVVVGMLSDRWPQPTKHLKSVAFMLVIAGISMGVLGVTSAETAMIAATIVFFALGWSWPGLVHYAVLLTHSSSPARATTYMQVGTFMGAVLGPLSFGILADYGSFAAAWLIAAVSVLLSSVLLLWGTSRLRKDAAHHKQVVATDTARLQR